MVRGRGEFSILGVFVARITKVIAQFVLIGYAHFSILIFMKRVIVTGGSGFIGTHLVSLLVDQGHQVLNLDKSEPLNLEQRKFHHPADILERRGDSPRVRRVPTAVALTSGRPNGLR